MQKGVDGIYDFLESKEESKEISETIGTHQGLISPPQAHNQKIATEIHTGFELLTNSPKNDYGTKESRRNSKYSSRSKGSKMHQNTLRISEREGIITPKNQ